MVPGMVAEGAIPHRLVKTPRRRFSLAVGGCASHLYGPWEGGRGAQTPSRRENATTEVCGGFRFILSPLLGHEAATVYPCFKRQPRQSSPSAADPSEKRAQGCLEHPAARRRLEAADRSTEPRATPQEVALCGRKSPSSPRRQPAASSSSSSCFSSRSSSYAGASQVIRFRYVSGL